MTERWLLDVNVPTGLAAKLAGLGIDAETAAELGWKELTNGSLLEAAANAGFTAILTRDRRFGEAASKALQRIQAIAVVVVTIRQARVQEFLSAFDSEWLSQRIVPVSGKVISWP